ncbi:transglycosylase SLT domain-containing protein [Sandaracinobacteroides sp. A072]|uniref:transglycosylase SLT domain-containing protein n=1 Tax=Sandaracinobacteroides sp. A072 TaxID=3461146 RepID=UPI004041A354
MFDRLHRMSAMSAPAPGRASVLSALEAAAKRTGVDFGALYHVARLESGLNPAARAKTSSATGLFQFIESTWLETLRRHGARHGIAPSGRADALSLRTDPGIASLMAAEHMADNGEALARGLGRQATTTDLYLAHFLGVAGALGFLSALRTTPDRSAAGLLPQAARANRAIFYAPDGTARSLEQVHDLFARKLGGTDVPALSASAGKAVPPVLSSPGPDEAQIRDSRARLAARAAYLLLADLGV